MPGIAFARLDAGSPQATVTAVGTTRSGSPTLDAVVNLVTTSVGQTAVTLPTAGNGTVGTTGTMMVVRTTSATAALVFPPSGGAINGGSADASFSVAQNKPTVFIPLANGIDYIAVLSA